jgi:hypothetical protein
MTALLRRRSLLVLLTVALFGVSCASAEATGGGFELSVEQLSQEAQPEADPAGDWAVEIATAKPEIPVVTAFASPPPELGIDDPPPDPATLPGAQLSAIPGPTPNVTSAAVLGGWSFNNPTYFDNPLVVLVTREEGDWLKVMVPTRPNLQEGWIKRAEVDVATHQWHAEINITTNTLKVWDGDELRADTLIVDGKASSPTPLGRFYFNEKIQRTPTSAYGSWILSTNAYSDSLEVFDDGMPVFAVHGTNNPGQIGTDISNGCVRVPNEIIEMMANEMPMGSPIDVVA